MRILLAVQIAVAALLVASPGRANDAVAECKAFFDKFQKCIDGLQGDQKQEAQIFYKSLRGTLGLSDDLNQGDPMMIGIMCSGAMEETKKEPMVQKYNCAW
jgi:hypothetical protein